jgi:hypothetical protein
LDKWVEADRETEGYGMADRATAAVHKLICGMVTVQEASLGTVEDGVASYFSVRDLCICQT